MFSSVEYTLKLFVASRSELKALISRGVRSAIESEYSHGPQIDSSSSDETIKSVQV